MEKHESRSVRLDREVWEALAISPLSANQLLRLQLGLDDEAKPSRQRLKRIEREAAARAASDLTAKAVGRPEIDYSDTESTPTTHVASLDAVGPSVAENRGKASLEDWRSKRKPLPKPRDRK